YVAQRELEEKEPPGQIRNSIAELISWAERVKSQKKRGTIEVKKLYVPIESIDFIQEGKIGLLLDTSDANLLQIASALYRMSKSEQMKHIVQHRNVLLQETTLSGIMLDKASMRASRLREISTVVPNLADDFFVLRHHAKVNLLRSLVISVLGLFVLVFGLFRDEKADPPPETDSVSAA
ncbi:MAG: hypothetical protein D3917_01440, partial [Candidatus Electrothrix sp. AX5]|nr:hypothetical protein [Candidatus Electrothrix sp. AX5]